MFFPPGIPLSRAHTLAKVSIFSFFVVSQISTKPHAITFLFESVLISSKMHRASPKISFSRGSTLAKFSDFSPTIILKIFSYSYTFTLHSAKAFHSTRIMFLFPRTLTFRDSTLTKLSIYCRIIISITLTKFYMSILHFAKVLYSMRMPRSKHKTFPPPCYLPQNTTANHAKTRNAAWTTSSKCGVKLKPKKVPSHIY